MLYNAIARACLFAHAVACAHERQRVCFEAWGAKPCTHLAAPGCAAQRLAGAPGAWRLMVQVAEGSAVLAIAKKSCHNSADTSTAKTTGPKALGER